MLKFSLLFVVLFVALFLLQITQVAQDAVITPFTSGVAALSAWVMQLFDPSVISAGNVLGDPASHRTILIVPGCNGIEAMIILFSALVAFPAPWLYKLKGLFWGFIAIHALNTVRIISLFYLLQWDQAWFEWFHLYVWQALIILDALIVWLIWLRYMPKKDGHDSDPKPGSTENPDPSLAV